MQNRLLATLIAGLALLSTATAAVPAALSTEGLAVGTEAPAFTLLDTHGRQVDSQSLRGRTVVLNFWAFWCDTWKAELPHLKELSKHEDDSAFTTVAVSVDGTRYPEFLKLTRGDLPFPVCLDIGSKVTRAYRVSHVPTVVVIDPSGRIVYSHYGYPGNDIVLSQVRRIPKSVAQH